MAERNRESDEKERKAMQQTSAPLKFQGRTLTLVTKTLRLALPVIRGGFVWNRPVSVIVTDAAGQEQIVPVLDLTRQAQWMLLGIGLGVALASGLIFKMRQRSTQEKMS